MKLLSIGIITVTLFSFVRCHEETAGGLLLATTSSRGEVGRNPTGPTLELLLADSPHVELYKRVFQALSSTKSKTFFHRKLSSEECRYAQRELAETGIHDSITIEHCKETVKGSHVFVECSPSSSFVSACSKAQGRLVQSYEELECEGASPLSIIQPLCLHTACDVGEYADYMKDLYADDPIGSCKLEFSLNETNSTVDNVSEECDIPIVYSNVDDDAFCEEKYYETETYTKCDYAESMVNIDTSPCYDAGGRPVFLDAEEYCAGLINDVVERGQYLNMAFCVHTSCSVEEYIAKINDSANNQDDDNDNVVHNFNCEYKYTESMPEVNNPVNKNGGKCKLEVAEIKCVLVDSGNPCESLKEVACQTFPDPSYEIVAEYTFEYTNKGSKKIKFSKENPANGKEITFASANRKAVNIKRGQRLNAGKTKRFTTRRTLRPCIEKGEGVPRNRFVAEHRMDGFVVGKRRSAKHKCKAGDYYSHNFIVSPLKPPF